jgi:5-methylcytosine-specific restriction endonuclease McrA
MNSEKKKAYNRKTPLGRTGYHLDHIIPLARGGKNEDRNMQVTCPTCNRQKHSKDPIEFMQSRGYLL